MAIEQGLVFSFKDVLLECALIKSFAHRFLDATTISAIDEARGTLQTIQSQAAAGTLTKWSIPADRPVRTKWSEGDSKPAKGSQHHIRGEFSFVWQIRPLDEDKYRGRSHFLLDGLASTVISFVPKGIDREAIAQWSVDVGDHQSPGVHFHAQVKRFGTAPFPDSLDVPRLPALPMSPFLVLEFAIGELFQDKWRAHAVADTTDARRWRAIQEPRLRRFFAWQLERLKATSVGSPWMGLKTGRPLPDLLLEAG